MTNKNLFQYYYRLIRDTLRGHAPRQLIIQMTDRCNAYCPQCGMRVTNKFTRTSLSEDTLKKLIDTAARRGVSMISFTGGEPLLNIDLLIRLIRYSYNAGIPYIRIGTNGFSFANPSDSSFEKRVTSIVNKLSQTPLRNFWISIDSSEAMVHERMRGLTDVMKGIERALPIFHAAHIYPAANMGINRNMAGENSIPLLQEPGLYRDRCTFAANKFLSRVKAMGFTTVNMCYPMSLNTNDKTTGIPESVYGAVSGNAIVRFTQEEKSLLFDGLSDAISQNRHSIRIFTPLSSLYILSKSINDFRYIPPPCLGGKDFFFSSVNGSIYPCGFRGTEPQDDTWGKTFKGFKSKPCYKCEWECFRDPSNLVAPLFSFMQHPVRFFKNHVKDPTWMKLWLTDIRYFDACEFFDGRIPPDYQKLARFTK